jgi:hypothetical protein
MLRAFPKGGMEGARTATSPQIWVPHLRDSLIVAKVGIVRSATVFLRTDHTLKAAGAEVADTRCQGTNVCRITTEKPTAQNYTAQ